MTAAPTSTWSVISPDGLPISTVTYRNRVDAYDALMDWTKRFVVQGHYKTATGERIPVQHLPMRCVVVENVKDTLTRVTVQQLLDVLSRANIVLAQYDEHDEHGELREEIREVWQCLRSDHVDQDGYLGTAPQDYEERLARICARLRAMQIFAVDEHTGGGCYTLMIPDPQARGTWYWGAQNSETWGGGLMFDCELIGDVIDTELAADAPVAVVAERIAREMTNIGICARPGVLTEVMHHMREMYRVLATVEFPGYIQIPDGNTDAGRELVWACGTVNNDQWEAQLQTNGGDDVEVVTTAVTSIPATEANSYTIANALAAAIGLTNDAWKGLPPTNNCATCQNGRRLPIAATKCTTVTEGHSLAVYCSDCGRCIQA